MTKLNQAKDQLSQALAELELAIINKLNQTKQIAVAGSGADVHNQEIINNLSNQINSLQKSLAELGLENESLRTTNQELQNFKTQAKKTANHIKIDLTKIKNIINQN